jgi:predicted lysophospholipase L1 biosynthesis ABC-type transport system permease subunit
MAAPRRRVDLTRLPRWAQYLTGAVLAAVVAALIWVAGDHHSAPGWYAVGVKIAAVVLLVAGAVWLIRRLLRLR